MRYVETLFNLEGKTAAIYGAAGYLCSEMARGFLRAGVNVMLLDRDAQKLQRVESELRSESDRVRCLSVDVTQKADHQRACDQTIQAFGRVDILINGAGINAPTPFMDITLDEWTSIIHSHVTGTMLACQVFGAHMLANQSGSIINLSSASADPPLSKAFSYSVAKAGIKNLTKNLGREWAKSGVRVNALRPGFFPTEWSKQHFITPERHEAILNHTPMGRYGQPEELVGAVLWLASDAARFVTGAEIPVDGGFSAMTI